MSLIETVYIFNHRNVCVLQHPVSSTAVSGVDLVAALASVPEPRPAVVMLPKQAVPTPVYSIRRDDLLVATIVMREAEPLEVLELLHRIVDVLEEFLGAPLLPARIEQSYHIVGQVLDEMLDGGLAAVSEPNALQELVTRPGWMEKLLSGVGLSGPVSAISPSALTSGLSNMTIRPTNNADSAMATPTPWRKTNVRHTTNRMTIDMVETIDAIVAPSGKIIAGRATGSIAFTSEVSGVPEVVLTLTSPDGQVGVAGRVQYPVFHPCVRLGLWEERPGHLSFIPPDGRFVLAGYETDLVGPDYLDRAVVQAESTGRQRVQTPPSARIPILAALYRGSDSISSTRALEVRLLIDPDFATASSSSTATGSSGPSPSTAGVAAGALSMSTPGPSKPTLDGATICVPAVPAVRAYTDIRATTGEAYYNHANRQLEWKISTKEAAALLAKRRSSEAFEAATLRCLIAPEDDDIDDRAGPDGSPGANGGAARQAAGWESQETDDRPQRDDSTSRTRDRTVPGSAEASADDTALFPPVATIRFQVTGWLASGLRVHTLSLDQRRSRALVAKTMPQKRVKYVSTSNDGVEIRCNWT